MITTTNNYDYHWLIIVKAWLVHFGDVVRVRVSLVVQHVCVVVRGGERGVPHAGRQQRRAARVAQPAARHLHLPAHQYRVRSEQNTWHTSLLYFTWYRSHSVLPFSTLYMIHTQLTYRETHEGLAHALLQEGANDICGRCSVHVDPTLQRLLRPN